MHALHKHNITSIYAYTVKHHFNIPQPWRVFINGVIPETGKPRPYLEMGPAIRKLYDVSKQLIQDPAFMVDPDWRFLAHDEQVSKHHEKWRNHLKQESKVSISEPMQSVMR